MQLLGALLVLRIVSAKFQTSNEQIEECIPPMRRCEPSDPSSTCYPEQWVCDGEFDCDNHSDEPENCQKRVCDLNTEIKCQSGRCFPRGFMCDGENDCGLLPNGEEDFTDEDPAICLKAYPCTANEYHCLKTPMCLHLSKFCDGNVDCADGSDEHTQCVSSETQEMNATCAFAGRMTLDGFKCFCPNGKQFVNGTCEFENLCLRRDIGKTPVCSQNCEDLRNGSVACTCVDAKSKFYDQKYCAKSPEMPTIAVLTKRKLLVFKNNTQLPELKFNASIHAKHVLLRRAPGVDGAPVVCFARAAGVVENYIECASQSTTRRYRFRNSLASVADNPFILYDELHANWVISDGTYFVICRHNEEIVSLCKYIVVGDIGFMNYIVMDPVAGLLFYADAQYRTVGIFRVDVVTGERTLITRHPAMTPGGIGIDIFTQTLYFLDKVTDSIHAIDYYAKFKQRTVVEPGKLKYSGYITYAEGRLYMTTHKRLLVGDTLSKSSQVPMFVGTTSDEIASVIHLENVNYAALVKKKTCDNCDSGMCVHKDGKPVCFCDKGTSGNGKCIKSWDKTKRLMFARMRPSGILFMEIPPEGAKMKLDVEVRVPVRQVSAFTVDQKGGRMIVFDATNQAFVVSPLNDEDMKTKISFVPVVGVHSCEGVAYDDASDNLYYTDHERLAVVVMKLSNYTQSKILVQGGMVSPRSIVLHVGKGYMFWGSWSERNVHGVAPKIERAKLDGSQRKTLVSKNVMWVNGLTIDAKNDYLYWCDAFHNVIERIHFNGADRQIIVNGAERVFHPYGIVLDDGFVYWGELKKGRVKRARIENATVVEELYSETTTVFEVNVYDPKRSASTLTKDTLRSPCATNNGGCEQFCFSMACKSIVGCEPIVCGCRDGDKRDANNPKLCIEDKDFKHATTCNEKHRQFRCLVSLKCIERSEVCDGDKDCSDGSDEDPNGVCKDFKCFAGRFQCDHTNCVPQESLCDGVRDCVDGSDEAPAMCTGWKHTCASNMFQCNNATCIPKSEACDGFKDCPQGEDELNCTKPECSQTAFRCGNGQCISEWLVCDGTRHCRDGLDEAHCKVGCVVGRQFRCDSGSACLDNLYRCDGVVDCADRSDEDEKYCRSTEKPCSRANAFQCNDGKCLRQAAVCDGYPDCRSGEDEANCTTSCNSTTLSLCAMTKKCIPKNFLCDGFNDCGDNSDEAPCNSQRKGVLDSKCQSPDYMCASALMCIPKEKVCDGVPDCPEGDDEDVMCNIECDQSRCHQKCFQHPFGPVCACNEGYYLEEDKFTCTKKNPCRFGACSQRCQAHGSTKYCYCDEGFRLHSDKFTCRADDSQTEFILYTNRHEIRQLAFGASSPVLAPLQNAVALDYYLHLNGSATVYWSDLASDIIYAGLLEDRSVSFVRRMISYGVFVAEGLAVDWVTGNVYWVDSNLDHIEAITTDGARTVVVSNDIANIRAIALDAEEGLMFWTDWEEKRPRIERATMAGTNRTMIFNVSGVVGGGWPNGITVDIISKRIYWVDAKSDSIHTTTYDGSDHVEVARDSVKLGHTFSVDVFENHVYFTDWRTNTICRMNKWDGSGYEVIERATKQPFSLRIVHRSKQRRPRKNICKDAGCSGACLLDGPNSFKCICPNMSKRDSTGNCTAVANPMVVVSRNAIRVFDADPPYQLAYPVVSGSAFESIRAVDVVNDEIYVLDANKQAIVKLNLHDNQPEKLLVSGEMTSCSGLAVDASTGNIYFSVQVDGVARIDLATGDGKFRRTLINSGDFPEIQRPRDLIFFHGLNQLIWFDDAYQPPAMFSAFGDGSSPQKIIEARTAKATAPVGDFERNRLIWISKDTNQLVTYSVNTSHFFLTSLPKGISTLTVTTSKSNDVLFVADANTSSLVFPFDFSEGKLSKALKSSNYSLDVPSDAGLRFVIGRPKATPFTCPNCKALCLRGKGGEKVCRCWQGAELVNGTCTDPKKTVFFVSEDGALHSVAINEAGTQTLLAHTLHATIANRRILRLATDSKRGVLYILTKDNEVWTAARNGSSAGLVYAALGHKLSSLAVDEGTGYVLVASRPSSAIGGIIMVLDPTRTDVDIRMTIAVDHEKTPYEIAVDPPQGRVFWASARCIKTSTYSGEDARCIVNKGVSALSLDRKASRVCYVADDMAAVDCVNYNGTDEQRNVAMFRPQGIGDTVSFTISGDELYFFDKFNSSGAIVKCVREKDGTFSPRGAVLKRSPRQKLRLFDLAVMDTNVDVVFTACSNKNGGCEHLCLTSFNAQELRAKKQCMCVHSKLSADGSCVPHDSFVAYSRQRSLEFAHLPHSVSYTSPPHRPITTKECDLAHGGQLAADSTRSQLFFSDPEKHRISAVNVDGSGCRIISEEVGIVDGMAFDTVHRQLIYSRRSPPSLWMVDLQNETAETTLVLMTLREQPSRIAIYPCQMLIYYVSETINGAIIERVYYSGFKRQTIIQEGVNAVRGLAIDFDAQKLYISDGVTYRICRCDLDGTKFEVVFENVPLVHPFQLDVRHGMIFFTDFINRAIFSANKVTGDGFRIVANLTDPPTDVVIFSPAVLDCKSDACTTSNLTCGDACRITADGHAECSCYGERHLSDDNRTCTGTAAPLKCAENEFACLASGRCIPYEETCDGYNDCPMFDDEDIKYCSTRTCRPGYFSCGSGLCVPESKRCNRVNDCFNYADEVDCKCRSDEFKCASGVCIAVDGRCDNKRDCNDASDEKDCKARNCSLIVEMGANMVNCKSTTQCILPSWICDGRNDCWDGSDEVDCPSLFEDKSMGDSSECPPAMFRCNSTRTCMPQAWNCDGEFDCVDGSDEANCDNKCSPRFEFKCPSTGECIAMEEKCDGRSNCANGEDELGCEHNECAGEGNTTFRCTNQRCIPIAWRCDGTDDCMDNAHAVGSDESNCGGAGTRRVPGYCNNGICESDVSCLLTAAFCDGIRDCEEGTDEDVCLDRDRYRCADNQFTCASGQCINASQRCDHNVNCVDGSDEWPDTCADSETTRACPMRCALLNGTIGCLSSAEVCDGIKDCIAGFDELRCHYGTDKPDNFPCPTDMVSSKNGPAYECVCKTGFVSPFDKISCLPKPACPLANCSHFCVDSPSSGHRCLCAEGYVLADNEHDCKRKDSVEAELLLTYGHRLKLYTLDGHSKATLLSNLTNGVLVDYDVRSNLVYWTDISRKGLQFGSVSLSGEPNSFRLLHGLPTKSVDGLAVDWLGRNLYYADRQQDCIAVCNMRGRFQRVLLKGAPLNDPRAIVLDPVKGLLFWTDWGISAHLGRMRMDGTEVRVIVQDHTIRWPNALAVDGPAQRLFYGDARRDYIASCDYDGSRRRVILRNAVRHVFALFVFDNYIYWSDWHNYTVERAHKVTGEHRKVLIHDPQYRTMGLKVVHPGLQSFGSTLTAKHACSQPARCDNLCVPVDSTEGFVCMCAQGFGAKDRSCVSECKPLDMICSGTYKCIPRWWRCDGQDDCGDGEDEAFFDPRVCPPFPCEPGQFACKPKVANETTCLYSSRLCDGNYDCPLGEDESSQFCESFDCGEGHFKCAKSHKCLPLSAVCDGREDCNDGSDERDCEIKNCGVGFFGCVNSTSDVIVRCIPDEFYCDGEKDCSGGEDEPFSCAITPCTSTQFRCSSGKCIAKARHCDGFADCRDASDEKDCANGNWTCSTLNETLSNDKLCDGKNHCSDGSDESQEACVFRLVALRPSKNNCSMCTDGKCNNEPQLCDGVADCFDGSDERNCTRTCNDDEYLCADKLLCVRVENVCDGSDDCFDASDERFCETSRQKFACDGADSGKDQWVAKHRVCDGFNDCLSGRDEDKTTCTNRTRVQCPYMARCRDGTQCYAMNAHCDGVVDCIDGSDEDPLTCNKVCQGRFRCMDGRCIDKSLVCDGRDDCGDASDEESCGDACHHFGICSQRCWNIHKSTTLCHCVHGYIRARNSYTSCVPLSNFTEIYVLNGYKIHWFTFDGDSSLTRMPDVPSWKYKDIDFMYSDEKTELIGVFSDTNSKSRVNSFFSYNATSGLSARPKRLIRFEVPQPDIRIAYDYLYNNIYFNEPLSVYTKSGWQHNIFAKTASGSLPRAIIVNSTGQVSSIAVASEFNRLFWTVTSPVPVVFASHLDGTPIMISNASRQPIVLRHVYAPHSLVADVANERIYWLDDFKRTIESSLFDGANRRTVKKFPRTEELPITMDVLGDYLFIIGRAGTVQQMHKFTGVTMAFRERIATSSRVAIRVANVAKRTATRSVARKDIVVPCQPDTCPSDSVCVPHEDENGELTSSCRCGLAEYFDDDRRSCKPLNQKPTVADQCFDNYCYNGAYCNTKQRRCVCANGFSGLYCEINACTDQCFNGAQCFLGTATDDFYFECRCPANYTSPLCEFHICDGVCGPHGECRIQKCPEGVTHCKGYATCECDAGWTGHQCLKRVDADDDRDHDGDSCSKFCFNGGECTGGSDGQHKLVEEMWCACPSFYAGRRCEDCEMESGVTLECHNGGHCVDRRYCECAPGFGGINCEKNICDGACPVGYTCSPDPTSPRKVSCQCTPSSGSSNPECRSMCLTHKDWCLNGGECVRDHPDCRCPSRFTGPRCQSEVTCDEFCLNSGRCSANDTHLHCECPPKYMGPRCEQKASCLVDGCANGGTCSQLDDSVSVCICPRGVAGRICTELAADVCSDIDCHFGGVCVQKHDDDGKPYPSCVCPSERSGLTCSERSCNDFCVDGQVCSQILGFAPNCSCPEGYEGAKCDVHIEAVKSANQSSGVLSKIAFLVVLTTLVSLIVYGVKSKRIHTLRQFRHTQMENDVPIDEFSNPAYLVDEDEFALGQSRETTQFTNQAFQNEVYNDTVTNNAEDTELLPMNQ